MKVADARVTPDWLALREPADAAARSKALVDALVAGRDGAGSSPLVVHDLGCGGGSMGRWLAPRLPGPQHWVLHDRDEDLLGLAVSHAPTAAADGSAVTVEPRLTDLARLGAADLDGAGLVTASALLDMLTEEEVDRLVRACVGAGCPALLTLSVTGHVALTPPDPLDPELESAFNDHQRRTVVGRTLLGPDASEIAADRFRDLGWRVDVAPSPWQLGPVQAELTREWLDGWAGAAVEQRPELSSAARSWLVGRRREAGDALAVTVQHVDLLARPGSTRTLNRAAGSSVSPEEGRTARHADGGRPG